MGAVPGGLAFLLSGRPGTAVPGFSHSVPSALRWLLLFPAFVPSVAPYGREGARLGSVRSGLAHSTISSNWTIGS